MATVRHSVTGQVTDLTGEPFTRAARAYIRTDLPADEYLTDLTSGGIQLGIERIEIQDDGTFEIGDLIATNNDPDDVNWVDFHYQVVITIPNLNAQPGTIVTARTPWFALEGDVDINDVIASDYAPPTAVSDLLAAMTANVTAAAASASSAATSATSAAASAASALASKIAAEAAEAAAEEIAGLTGEDDAVAFLLSHPSDTRTAAMDLFGDLGMAANTVDTGARFRLILFSNGTVRAIPYATPDPLPPTALAAEARLTSVVLTWTAPATGAVGSYAIWRDGVQVGTSTIRSYRDTGIVVGNTYDYAVQTIDPYGQRSDLTDEESAFINPALNVAPTITVKSWPATAPTNGRTLIRVCAADVNAQTLTLALECDEGSLEATDDPSIWYYTPEA